MYISGLSKIKYMDIQQNIKPYRGQNDLNSSKTNFTLKQLSMNDKGNKFMLVPDILNENITMNMVELELLRQNNDFSFVLSASTSNNSEMQIFKNDKEIAIFIEEDENGFKLPQDQFYLVEDEKIMDLTFLETPVNEALIKQVALTEMMIDKMKVIPHQRLTVKKSQMMQ